MLRVCVLLVLGVSALFNAPVTLVATLNGTVVALNSNGKEVWSHTTGGSVAWDVVLGTNVDSFVRMGDVATVTTPHARHHIDISEATSDSFSRIQDGLVLVTNKTSSLASVRVSDGRVLNDGLKEGTEGGSTAAEPTVMIGRTDYYIRALDQKTGAEQWNLSYGEYFIFDPISDLTPRTVRDLGQPGWDDSSLVAYDPTSGGQAWSVSLLSAPLAIFEISHEGVRRGTTLALPSASEERNDTTRGALVVVSPGVDVECDSSFLYSVQPGESVSENTTIAENETITTTASSLDDAVSLPGLSLWITMAVCLTLFVLLLYRYRSTWAQVGAILGLLDRHSPGGTHHGPVNVRADPPKSLNLDGENSVLLSPPRASSGEDSVADLPTDASTSSDEHTALLRRGSESTPVIGDEVSRLRRQRLTTSPSLPDFNMIRRGHSLPPQNRQPALGSSPISIPIPEDSTVADGSSPSIGSSVPSHLGESPPSRYRAEFEEVCKLGRGAYGSVFKARNKLDGRFYAIKKVKMEGGQALTRILREVKMVADMDHRNVIRYYNAWVEHVPRESSMAAALGLEDDEEEYSVNGESFVGSSLGDDDMGSLLDGFAPIFGDDFLADLVRDKSNSAEPVAFVRGGATTPLVWGEESMGSSLDFSTSKSPVVTPATTLSILCIQVQLCEVGTLKAHIEGFADGGGMPISEVSSIFEQIAAGLEHVHAKGVVHRDLSTGNVFLTSDMVCKIGDFGLSKRLDEVTSPSIAGRVTLGVGAFANPDHTLDIGTPLYTAPELCGDQQAKDTGPQSFAVDVYSLGIILVELLHPFSTAAERIGTLLRLRDGGAIPSLIPQRSPEAVALIETMLSPAPSLRPAASALAKVRLAAGT